MWKRAQVTDAYHPQEEERVEWDADEKKKGIAPRSMLTEVVECPICFDLFETSDLTVLTPCLHAFCANCLRKQLRRDGRCAICRTAFYETSPPLVYNLHNVHSVRLKRHAVTGRFGIRLKGQPQKSIRIRGVSWYHFFLCGIRSSMELVALNNIPCYNQAAVMHLLNDPSLRSVTFHLRIPPPRWKTEEADSSREP